MPKALKYRIRKAAPLSSGTMTVEEAQAAVRAAQTPAPAAAPQPRPTPTAEATAEKLRDQRGETAAPMAPATETEIDALRQEGLTGRQLRMARRVAQKHGLAVTSDYDAVRQLRAKGIDPFQRSNILELVVPGPNGQSADGTAPPITAKPGSPVPANVQLPQTAPAGTNLPAVDGMDPAQRRAIEIAKVQKDMAQRRRRKTLLLFTRLAMFVALPTLMAAWYFFFIATPMYATHAEFRIEQSESQGGAAGFGGLFSGTALADQRDGSATQSFLTSREAFLRLEEEHDFRAHFSDDAIDPIQRLPEDATNEAAFAVYQDHVKLRYDPTEGIIRLEVIAADPASSQRFSEALIDYAEERVDNLTQRVREDQMSGARTAYEEAEQRRSDALASLLAIQEQVQQIDPAGETSARIQQISALESQRQELQVSLAQRLNVARPNEAQVNALRSQIESIDTLIAQLRQEMTSSTNGGGSLAANNTELRLAEENYAFQTVLVQQALQQMESARIEANRQVRYLSLGVAPIAPDEPTYPKAFENTILAFLIFAGVYLMISLTASILREQVAS